MIFLASLVLLAVASDLPPVRVQDPPPLKYAYPLPPVVRPLPTIPRPHANWPANLAVPPGLRTYTPAKLTQRLVIRDGFPHHAWYGIGQHDYFANAPVAINPNTISPWKTSGGMDAAHGFQSVKMTTVKKQEVKTARANLHVPMAGRDLPGFLWTFPEGAIFVDFLTNEKSQPFEIRQRTKIDGKWKSKIIFEDAAVAPKGYAAAGQCQKCHENAGKSLNYGIALRGSDSVFSFNPLE